MIHEGKWKEGPVWTNRIAEIWSFNSPLFSSVKTSFPACVLGKLGNTWLLADEERREGQRATTSVHLRSPGCSKRLWRPSWGSLSDFLLGRRLDGNCGKCNCNGFAQLRPADRSETPAAALLSPRFARSPLVAGYWTEIAGKVTITATAETSRWIGRAISTLILHGHAAHLRTTEFSSEF